MPETTWLAAAEWLAVLRIALGLWWLESWRHKDRRAWLERGAGIDWAASVAAEHPLPAVTALFDRVVAPRKLLFARLVVWTELALGVTLTLGLLTPVALVVSVGVNSAYLTLMIRDVAEQGQNLMMIAIAVVCLFAHAWQAWSLDAALGWF